MSVHPSNRLPAAAGDALSSPAADASGGGDLFNSLVSGMAAAPAPVGDDGADSETETPTVAAADPGAPPAKEVPESVEQLLALVGASRTHAAGKAKQAPEAEAKQKQPSGDGTEDPALPTPPALVASASPAPSPAALPATTPPPAAAIPMTVAAAANAPAPVTAASTSPVAHPAQQPASLAAAAPAPVAAASVPPAPPLRATQPASPAAPVAVPASPAGPRTAALASPVAVDPAARPTASTMTAAAALAAAPIAAPAAPVPGQPAEAQAAATPDAIPADSAPAPKTASAPVTQATTAAPQAAAPAANEAASAAIRSLLAEIGAPAVRHRSERSLAAETAAPLSMPAGPRLEQASLAAAPAPLAPAQPHDAAQAAAPATPLQGLVIERQLDLAHQQDWIDQLARDITSFAGGGEGGALRFRLNPEHLGTLHVEIAQSHHGAAVRFSADSEAARAIIADAQPRLVAEARAQGVRISEAHVDLGSGGSGDPRRQPAAPADVPLRTARSLQGEQTSPARGGKPTPGPRELYA